MSERVTCGAPIARRMVPADETLDAQANQACPPGLYDDCECPEKCARSREVAVECWRVYMMEAANHAEE